MLRALVVALALGAPGLAAAQQFPDSAVGIEVRGDDGTVIGRVEAVERDADGRIVAAEISDQEPATAPFAPDSMIAERADARGVLRVNDRDDDRRARRGVRRDEVLLR